MKATALDVGAEDCRRNHFPPGVEQEGALDGVDAVRHREQARDVGAGEDERPVVASG